MEDLHELLCLCWREGSVPQDMQDAKIVTLYKDKGDRKDCNSYCGISLLLAKHLLESFWSGCKP